MALVDIDTWITEYAACERLSRDIQTQIVLRNKEPRLSTEYSKISSGIRFNLKQFLTNLDQLNQTIQQSAQRSTITRQEAERRQRQVETLQSQYIHLQSQFMNVSNDNNDRKQLLGEEKKSNSYWQDDDDDDEDEPLADFQPTSLGSREPTVDDLRKQQTKIIENQNDGLDALSKVISRQKSLAIRIGDEFDEQNEIIDTLATTMDNTNSRMNGTTRSVGEALDQGSTKRYWFVIIILFIINIIVAVV
ncbi:syntaxin-8 [Sitodiplosis mosellana]|uniref:syntaxin-8 n=1 Tax=Sitodiplosis mosellana TaxID=263140 RepID=UPI002443A162|nr:syntaxin-8 [Sitodiplosis mosellana]